MYRNFLIYCCGIIVAEVLAVNSQPPVRQVVYLTGPPNPPLHLNQPSAPPGFEPYTWRSPSTVLPQMPHVLGIVQNAQQPFYPFPSVAPNPGVISRGPSILVSDIPPPSMMTPNPVTPSMVPATAPNPVPFGVPSKSFTHMPPFNPGISPPPIVQKPEAQRLPASNTASLQPVQPTLEVSPPSVPTLPIKESSNSNPDSSILNNLAIALQLLIVNNILSKPLPEFNSEKLSLPFEAIPSISSFLPPNTEVSDPVTYYPSFGSIGQSSVMPNANFVGTSTLVEPAMVGFPAFTPPSRSSLSLMSPYEALGPMSPYSDPASSYSSKFDFQSPYASIMTDNRDLFSMTDLF